MKNLISKRIGIDDHFPIDKYSVAMFPNNPVCIDVIKNATDSESENKGKCMKNIYKSDEWIKCWIKHKWNKEIGKLYAYYVYNIDYDGIGKPVKKYIENNNENILYERSNGVMYYDFDNIGKETVDKIRKIFIILGEKYKCFQWFETSWSGNGCHIRINYDMKFHNKIEWQFVYMFYLDIIMKKLKTIIDVSTWYDDNTIDWSCATITRGFAIPYNENGVVENKYFNKESLPYKTKLELNILINAYTNDYWEKEIINKFMHNIGIKQYQNTDINSKFKNTYYVKDIDMSKVKEQNGEKFDYNWRLKCVTTLMNIYEGDKDKVRNACKYIYSFIKPYKNHTYEEMIGNELENKIFANGDMTYNASNEIIDDLNKYFGFNIQKQIKINEVYISDILRTI